MTDSARYAARGTGFATSLSNDVLHVALRQNVLKENSMASNDVTRDRDDAIRERDAAGRQGKDTNPDAITGAPGSHPVGTGLGAAGAGAAGAAIGAVGGPVGAAVGAVVGAVAGGLAGKGVAEAVNPTAEDEYWRENYRNRPYVEANAPYDDYRPAYQYGWESRSRYQGRSFDDVETDLRSDWERRHAGSSMTWDRAKGAARDAWDRVERAIPGDADRDGK